jgi:hypothetical protein
MPHGWNPDAIGTPPAGPLARRKPADNPSVKKLRLAADHRSITPFWPPLSFTPPVSFNLSQLAVDKGLSEKQRITFRP